MFPRQTTLALLMAVATSACTSVNAPARLGSNAPATTAGGQSEFVRFGKESLRLGQPGLAIDAFNKAAARGEDLAEAYNGLGIAYAKIGRIDLAQKYFALAIDKDPGDDRPVRNLARLLLSPENIAWRQSHRNGWRTLDATAPAKAGLQAQSQASMPAGVDSREIHISTGASPQQALAVRRLPRVESRTSQAVAAKPGRPFGVVLATQEVAGERSVVATGAIANPAPAAPRLAQRPRTVNMRNFAPLVRLDLQASGLSVPQGSRSLDMRNFKPLVRLDMQASTPAALKMRGAGGI